MSKTNRKKCERRLCAPGLTAKGNDLREMLECYCRDFRPNLAAYLKIFAKMSLKEAISAAPGAVCPCCRKRHPHQKRLPHAVFAEFSAGLAKLSDRIGKAKDFEELHEIIREGRVRGIGPVTLYDTALRIGAQISRLPERLVYCHGDAVIPGGKKSGTQSASSFDVLFAEHGMKAYEIEEFLCCFHSRLVEKNITVLERKEKTW